MTEEFVLLEIEEEDGTVVSSAIYEKETDSELWSAITRGKYNKRTLVEASQWEDGPVDGRARGLLYRKWHIPTRPKGGKFRMHLRTYGWC